MANIFDDHHPDNREELLSRARQLAGHTFAEIARVYEIELPPDLRRAKGWVGQTIETCLGATAGNRSVPDFEKLGIELKTLPVEARTGMPRESTYITTVQLLDIDNQRWEDSSLYHKLKHILWIPIQADPAISLADRIIGNPILWKPDSHEEQALRHDWEQHMSVIRAGMVDTITGRDGKYLQIRPKGANATNRTWAMGENDTQILTMPRGFYLRPCFTRRIIHEHLYNPP